MAESVPGIVVQARMGSTRLPGKVLADLAGAPSLMRLLERLKRVKTVHRFVVATSTLTADDAIDALVSGNGDVGLWRGPEQDVLKRYAQAARHFNLDPIVRITGDCPLISASCIDEVLRAFLRVPGCDYGDNIEPRTFPHGFDVQVVSRAALETADAEARDPAEREHVLPFIQCQPRRFRHVHVTANGMSHSDLRLTLDYPEDLAFIRAIYERLYPHDPAFDLDEILALLVAEPSLTEINRERRMFS
jgi:spore coat polysaccharide biosynthesis protein SpsF (cytidylyltransferase family)